MIGWQRYRCVDSLHGPEEARGEAAIGVAPPLSVLVIPSPAHAGSFITSLAEFSDASVRFRTFPAGILLSTVGRSDHNERQSLMNSNECVPESWRTHPREEKNTNKRSIRCASQKAAGIGNSKVHYSLGPKSPGVAPEGRYRDDSSPVKIKPQAVHFPCIHLTVTGLAKKHLSAR